MVSNNDIIRKEELYWYWAVNIPGIGRKILSNMLEQYQTPENIYSISEKEAALYLKPKVLEQFVLSRNWDKIEKNYESLKKRGICFLWPNHPDYPEKLKHLYDYPYGIYVKGRLPGNNQRAIAIVGARNADFYGNDMAQYMARELSKQGFAIISGLADGVDSHAHKGALEAEGYTLGILGCGINICYPKENYSIYRKMEEKGGIMTEYGLNVAPRSGLFPMRNRLIAAMSDGILVTQAREKSGSLITVDQGLELGRDIFALPGKACDEMSKGCNNLIKSGAKMVTEVSDILEEYSINQYKIQNNQTKEEIRLVKNEKMVYDNLRLKPKYIGTIIEETQLSVSEVLPVLFSLEKKGYIKQTAHHYYSVLL